MASYMFTGKEIIMNQSYMKKSTPDIIIGVVMMLFLISLSVQMPSIPKDSRTYPAILMGLSYLMVIILLVRGIVTYKKSEVVESQVKIQLKTLIPYGTMIVVYLALLGKIGYIFDTVLFCMVSLIYLKLKNKVAMVLLSLILTLVLYFVFTRFLSVILPRGSWISLNL